MAKGSKKEVVKEQEKTQDKQQSKQKEQEQKTKNGEKKSKVPVVIVMTDQRSKKKTFEKWFMSIDIVNSKHERLTSAF